MKLGPELWMKEEIHGDSGIECSPIGSDFLIVPWWSGPCSISIFDGRRDGRKAE
jgi:hypothetical protein